MLRVQNVLICGNEEFIDKGVETMEEIICVWCDLKAVYQRKYIVKRKRNHFTQEYPTRVMYSCKTHAKQLKMIKDGYPIHRIDGADILAGELLRVFNVEYQSPHSHHAKDFIS